MYLCKTCQAIVCEVFREHGFLTSSSRLPMLSECPGNYINFQKMLLKNPKRVSIRLGTLSQVTAHKLMKNVEETEICKLRGVIYF